MDHNPGCNTVGLFLLALCLCQHHDSSPGHVSGFRSPPIIAPRPNRAGGVFLRLFCEFLGRINPLRHYSLPHVLFQKLCLTTTLVVSRIRRVARQYCHLDGRGLWMVALDSNLVICAGRLQYVAHNCSTIAGCSPFVEHCSADNFGISRPSEVSLQVRELRL